MPPLLLLLLVLLLLLLRLLRLLLVLLVSPLVLSARPPGSGSTAWT